LSRNNFGHNSENFFRGIEEVVTIRCVTRCGSCGHADSRRTVTVDDLSVLAQHCECALDCVWIETSRGVDTLTQSRNAHKTLNLRSTIVSDKEAN
jgi:hypothetical protein